MMVRPLKGVRAVREAFAGPLRVRSGPIAAAGVQGECSDALAYVVVVAKHRVRRAVDRNRIKRLMREALRRVAARYHSDGVPLAAIVLRWQGSVDRRLTLWAILNHVQSVFDALVHRASAMNSNAKPS